MQWTQLLYDIIENKAYNHNHDKTRNTLPTNRFLCFQVI